MNRKTKSLSKKPRALSLRARKNAKHSSEWLTTEDAAEYLRVTPSTVYRWTKTGKLQAYQFDGAPIRIKRSDLEALAKPVHGKPEAWTQLSAAAFNEDWDNPEDAIYDDWRTLYGVQSR
jgi:excisionase family DNA binding protein